nr:hypothetical protein [Tanacetum cinerariifolium]
ALVPSRVDRLPPRKRFRDSISPEDSVEKDIDTDVLEDIKAYDMAVEVVVDRDVKAEIDVGIGMKVDVKIDVEDKVEDKVESSDRGTMKVGLEVVARIDIPDAHIISQEMWVPCCRPPAATVILSIYVTRALVPSRVDRLPPRKRFRDSISPEDSVEKDIDTDNMTITRFATRTANALEAENQSQNGSGGDNGNMGNGNGGNRNGENGNGKNENPNENDRGVRHVDQECTYQDSMKCQPLNYKGTKGVVMVPEEEDQVEKFIGGLPDNIQGNVIAAEPMRL